MKFISLCWQFLSYFDIRVALLVLDPRNTLADFLEPVVHQYYEQGIRERYPIGEIMYIAYVREHAASPQRRYVEICPLFDLDRRDDPAVRPVQNQELIALLDQELTCHSEMFVVNATDVEWESIAPEGMERPIIWCRVTDPLVQPAVLFRHAEKNLLLLIVRHPEATQEVIDRVVRANQEETARCFPGYRLSLAEYIPGAVKLRWSRYKVTQVPERWETLPSLKWKAVTAEADVGNLDELLMHDWMFLKLGTQPERERVGNDFRDYYWRAKRKAAS